MKITELPQPLQELARKYQRKTNNPYSNKNSDVLSNAFKWFETKEEYTFWKTLYWAHTIEEARQKMYESDRATLDRILARLSYLNISDNQLPIKPDDYFTLNNRGNKVLRKWENTDESILLWKKHCSKWLCEGEFQTIKCEVVKDGENDVLKKGI